MKIIKTGLKLLKLSSALLLFGFFYLLETILMVIYLIVETPLSWILDKVENVIKYLLKNM